MANPKDEKKKTAEAIDEGDMDKVVGGRSRDGSGDLKVVKVEPPTKGIEGSDIGSGGEE